MSAATVENCHYVFTPGCCLLPYQHTVINERQLLSGAITAATPPLHDDAGSVASACSGFCIAVAAPRVMSIMGVVWWLILVSCAVSSLLRIADGQVKALERAVALVEAHWVSMLDL